jgi:hypothetical protein
MKIKLWIIILFTVAMVFGTTDLTFSSETLRGEYEK